MIPRERDIKKTASKKEKRVKKGMTKKMRIERTRERERVCVFVCVCVREREIEGE